MRKHDCAFLLTYRLATLLPPSEWPLKTCAQRLLAYVYGVNATIRVAIRPSVVEWEGRHFKKKAASVKHKLVSGIAMPGGLTGMNGTDCERLLKVEPGLVDGISARQLSSDARSGSTLARSVRCRLVVAYRDTVNEPASWSLLISFTSLMTGFITASSAARCAPSVFDSVSFST